MRLGVLFSGGKDSTFALHKAAAKEEVACLITLIPENKESYMFHTPNIDVTALQAKALGLPLIKRVTEGKPEKELKDLEAAIVQAIKDYEHLSHNPKTIGNPFDVDKYVGYLKSTFDQVLDALGLDFDEIIGLTKLERFM